MKVTIKSKRCLDEKICWAEFTAIVWIPVRVGVTILVQVTLVTDNLQGIYNVDECVVKMLVS